MESSNNDLLVRHRSMADEVTERTRRLILTRELQPGQRIRQAELASMMGVSTMPVREALLRLVAEGMVLADSNRSFTVAMTTAPAGIRDIYWVHAMIAGELTARAWQRRNEGLLDEMSQRHATYMAALPSGVDAKPVLFGENWKFHSAIHHAAQAPAILLTLKNTLRYFPDFSQYLPGWYEVGAEWQAGLVAEFKTGTAEGARRVVAQCCVKSAELYVAAYWPEDSVAADKPAGKRRGAPAREKVASQPAKKPAARRPARARA